MGLVESPRTSSHIHTHPHSNVQSQARKHARVHAHKHAHKYKHKHSQTPHARTRTDAAHAVYGRFVLGLLGRQCRSRGPCCVQKFRLDLLDQIRTDEECARQLRNCIGDIGKFMCCSAAVRPLALAPAVWLVLSFGLRRLPLLQPLLLGYGRRDNRLRVADLIGEDLKRGLDLARVTVRVEFRADDGGERVGLKDY